MDLKYDIYTLHNSQGTGEERQYVHILQHDPMSEKALRKKIQDRCSLTQGDVAAVLSEIHDICAEELQRGSRFYLPGIGYFSLSAGLELPEEKPDKKISAKEVRISGINFRPEANLLQEVKRGVHFVRSRSTCQSVTYTEEKLLAKIKDYLQKNRYITSRILRFHFGLTQYSAQKWLKHFCRCGILTKDGTTHSPIYFLK